MAKLEDLKILTKGINRNKVKNIQIIGNRNKVPTIFDEFYQLLSVGKFETDDQYSQHFYGDNSQNKAYYKLKDRLFERLVNLIFFVDKNEKGVSPIQKSYYQCYKNAVAVKLLLGKSIRIPAIRLAEKTLKKCLFFGFSDIIIELTRHLNVHYSSYIYNKKKHKIYAKLIKKYLKIYKTEIIVENNLQMLIVYHRNQMVLNSKHASRFKKQKNFIQKNINNSESYKIVLQGYLFLSIYYELTGKWKKLEHICDQIINSKNIRPQLVSSSLIGFAYFRKLMSTFFLGKYTGTLQLVEKCFQYFKSGTFNWFLVQNLNIKIQFHLKNFTYAFDILEYIKSFKDSDLYYKFWEEHWKIHEAFIQYLNQIGKLKFKEDSQSTFRLQKFLNEVPNHSKDKKGSNITILILQILFLLEGQKYDALIDKAESLKVYTQRYLKGDGTYRSNCFIKMLLCLPAGNFERKQVEQKAQKYLDRLHAMPLEKAKQSAELEVMPYEMLWGFILESLDRPNK